MIIVSACLAGENCRYDARSCTDNKVLELIKEGSAITVCPEQLGGLSTPRPPAEKTGQRIITDTGHDVTKNFQDGAALAMELVRKGRVTQAIVKENSPMCGLNYVYDGTFSRTLKKGSGVFTTLLLKAGVNIESR